MAATGIVDIASYLPRHRLRSADLAAALGEPAGHGERAVAAFDEDTTTLAVEAMRRLASETVRPRSVWLSTTRPVYLEKSNAVTVVAANQLGTDVAGYDLHGSVRSGIAAFRAAVSSGASGLALLSDLRYGLPGSSETRLGGDAASAVLFGEDPIAEWVDTVSRSEELLDRWRPEGAVGARTWDDRWSSGLYRSLVEETVEQLLKQNDLTTSDVDHVVVSSPQVRAAAAIGKQFGATDAITGQFGYCGTAQIGLLLQDVLAVAEPDQTILAVAAADGADALLLRTTEHIEHHRPRPASETAAATAVAPNAFFTWRGLLDREPPKRPDPEAPASPPAQRNVAWKYAFVASRCRLCQARHMPPQRVCLSCHAVDEMTPEPMQDLPATVATYTIDRIAYSLNPPTAVAVLDFDGGGRYRCQLTDVETDAIAVGDRVEMTFRVIDIAPNGVRNYFWKARPILESGAGS